jgi:hypothetical protein
MRPIVLFRLTALVAMAGGCGSESREPATRSAPKRDLTLVTGVAQVEVASPVETRRIQPPYRARQAWSRVARPTPAAASSAVKLAAIWTPAQPATADAASNNPRELLPGKTVTLIPASSGPPTDVGRGDDLPEIRGRTKVAGGGGGTCRGRGRRPGIGVGSPAPDFR